MLSAACLVATGCTAPAVNQQPLMSDGGAPLDAPRRSLVLSDQALAEGAWITGRNDAAAGLKRRPPELYYGPGGQLYYSDGTAVQFKGVKKQLEDLRAEERINPVR